MGTLAELKTLLEREFGIYSSFLDPSLIKLSGYESPRSMFPDFKKEEEQIKKMLESASVTPEIMEKLNKVIFNRAKIMKEEIEWAKRENNQRHQKESQEIFKLFNNKELTLTKKGKVEIMVRI